MSSGEPERPKSPWAKRVETAAIEKEDSYSSYVARLPGILRVVEGQIHRQVMAIFHSRIVNTRGSITETFKVNERGCIARNESQMQAHSRPVWGGKVVIDEQAIGLLDCAMPTGEFIPKGLRRKKFPEFTLKDLRAAQRELQEWFPEIEITITEDKGNKTISYTAMIKN